MATGGHDSGFAAGQAHVEAVLEHLAQAGPDEGTDLAPLLAALHRGGNSGTLAVVTTSATSGSELEGIARLSRRFGVVTVVLLEPWPSQRRAAPHPSLASVVRVGPGQPFAQAWTAMITRRSGARVAR